MQRKRYLSIMALAAVVALVAAGCKKSGTGDNPTTGPATQTGGTFRVGTEDFGFTDAFDPTGEYLGTAWGYYSNLLLRNLVTYKHVTGADGNVLVPDLATDLPEISADGLTYTFKLKDGIKFGPPVNREITSADFVTAFERIGTKSLAAQYGFYYNGTIAGQQEFLDGKADSISGISAPDDKTIVFTLTKPTGDFLFRLAMPATSPVPEEVGKCFTKAGDYGRDVISSGPYMIDGSDKVDASSCDSIKAMSGYDPSKELKFVRNPNYDPSTDSKEDRESNVDSVDILINTNTNDIFNKIEAGDYESGISSPPAQVLRKYQTDPAFKDSLHADPGDRTWYVFMNLTQPPFDDIHVRKAVNLVLDKDGLLRAWGGPVRGEIATHIEPPEMTGGHPTADEYNPYPSDGFTGDEAAAKAEMKQSKYDSDGDGVCDAEACKNVQHITRNIPPWTDMEPIEEASLSKIGVTLKTTELDTSTAYTTIQTTAKNIPIGSNAGWGKDYADAYTFMGVLFDGRTIIPTGNTNYSLVGMTPAQVADLGVTGTTDNVPNVDADIDGCLPLEGDARAECWVNLDKKLMEQVVPWVPYLWATNVRITGPAVTKYGYDQFGGEIAFAHVAVDPSKQS